MLTDHIVDPLSSGNYLLTQASAIEIAHASRLQYSRLSAVVLRNDNKWHGGCGLYQPTDGLVAWCGSFKFVYG